MIAFGGRNIYQNSNERSDYNRICSKQMDMTARKFIINYSIILLASILAILGPVLAYVNHGIKTTTTNLRFPFTDENSNAEFIANIAFQFLIFFHGFSLYVGLEVTMLIFENTSNVTTKLIENDLKRFDLMNEISEPQERAIFKNIVKQAIDTDR